MSAARVAVVQRPGGGGGRGGWADTAANLATVAEVVRRLAGAADAVVFPELFLTGYVTRDVKTLAQPLDGEVVRALSELARRHGMLLVCGLPELAGDRVYNTAVVIEMDGSLAGAYRKTHLFGSEPSAFAAGDRLPVFDTSIGRLGVLVCYDIELPEPARVLAEQGAQIVVVPAANMDPYANFHEVYASARAMENGVHLLLANQIGRVGNVCMCGGSRIVSATGEILAAAGRTSALLLAELPSTVDVQDPALDYLAARRPDLYRHDVTH